MLFISPQKLFSFSRYLSFCLDFSVMYRNGLMLPNISKSKRNQTMKIGQLIECNMRNVFVEKPYTKYVGETSPRLFSEKLKLRISLDQ